VLPCEERPCRSFLAAGTGGRSAGEMAGAVACTPATLAKLSLGEKSAQRHRGACAATAALGRLANVYYEVLNQESQRR
jgi:hypothetical protein